MSQIAVITTFPNASWPIYARDMIQSFSANWPADIPLLLQLDDKMLVPDIQAIFAQYGRNGDAIAHEWEKEHIEFVERNKGKDHPQDYRMMPVRFCHKIFAIKRACASMMAAKANNEPTARYLIWLDADVHTTRKVTHEDLKLCLPKEGDAVAYMGRKDWDHSECGWLAFDLERGGAKIIEFIASLYTSDSIIKMEQQHDSWAWDYAINVFLEKKNATNLTPNATGRDVWEQSPMGKWSKHHKGPVAKQKLLGVEQPITMPQQQQVKIRVQTRNSIPDEQIRAQIAKNQQLIKNWIVPCTPTDEEIVVVSAGPTLIAEEVREEIKAGKKIVAVKNALVPLKKAGITPWACILLDPRQHVADFVQDADPSILWIVASQVHPQVTLELLARGCTVWGYHAAVNAGEEELTVKQEAAVVNGGSATATRGLYVLEHLGFSNFALYGYDLSYPDKPDFNAFNEIEENGKMVKQPKYMEMTACTNEPLYLQKRLYYTEPQFYAQFEELAFLINSGKFKFRAHGEGAIPFIVKGKKIGEMRRNELRAKLAGNKPVTYAELLEQ